MSLAYAGPDPVANDPDLTNTALVTGGLLMEHGETNAVLEPQTPLGSRFGFASTAAEVAAGHDLAGRNFVITGGHSGIGLETTRALAAAGARLTLGARDPLAAAEAIAGLAGDIEVARLDLADIDSVAAFARAWEATERPLHCLINNAGVMAMPETRIGRWNWEAQLGTNHHGHFALTMGLLAGLRRGAPDGGVRVVSVSSAAHVRGPFRRHDPHFRDGPYDKWEAYSSAKSANALFARGLDSRLAGDGIRAFSLHPGGILTPLQRHMPQEELEALGWVAKDGQSPPGFKTPQQGAATTVWCALSPQLAGRGGVYCEDCDIARRAGPDSPRWAHVRDHVLDDEAANALWWLSEYETGLRFH